VLSVEANNVLNSLAFVILLATSLEELIASCKPVKDLLISIASTLKQGVLS